MKLYYMVEDQEVAGEVGYHMTPANRPWLAKPCDNNRKLAQGGFQYNTSVGPESAL